MQLNFLKRRKAADEEIRAAHIYAAVTDRARVPDWYIACAVPDTVDGRFDMVVLMLSLYLLRLEACDDDAEARRMSTLLYERFVADMDASLREIGIGDMVISKHVGRAMEALGGRNNAYRVAFVDDAESPSDVLERNLYRGEAPSPAALALAAESARHEWDRLNSLSLDALLGKVK